MAKKIKATKIFLKNKPLCVSLTDAVYHNALILGACLALLISLLFLAALVNAANYGVNTPSSVDSNGEAGKAVEASKTERSRIVETGNEVIIDGSLRVLEVNFNKGLDLVETSTPTTPSSNHVRIFAVAIGTATAVKARFDDGTIKVITNN